MVRTDVIRRKLANLRRYLDALGRHRYTTFADYIADEGPRWEVERLLQLIVESAVDINVHVVTELGNAPPHDYRSSFDRAAAAGLIPVELAERLSPSAGLRNALVHEYDEIDNTRVHASIPLALDGFEEYVSAVTNWLERFERGPA